MAHRETFLLIFMILVTDMVARRDRHRTTCRGICKDREDEVIATRRPKSDRKCVAFVCSGCRLEKQLISDCWIIHEEKVVNSTGKANCIYEGKPIPDRQIVDSDEGSSISLEGNLLSAKSLASHFGAFAP